MQLKYYFLFQITWSGSVSIKTQYHQKTKTNDILKVNDTWPKCFTDEQTAHFIENSYHLNEYSLVKINT